MVSKTGKSFWVGNVRDLTHPSRGNILSSSSRTLIDYLCRHQFKKAAVFMNESWHTWGFPATSLILFRIHWEMKKQNPDFITRFVVKPHTFTDEHMQWVKDRKVPLQYLVHGREVFKNLAEDDVKSEVTRIPVVQDFSNRFEQFRHFSIWIFSRDEEAALTDKMG